MSVSSLLRVNTFSHHLALQSLDLAVFWRSSQFPLIGDPWPLSIPHLDSLRVFEGGEC